jgi:hypothetical protein
MDAPGRWEALTREAWDRGAIEEAVDGGDRLAVRGEDPGPAGEADMYGDDDGALAMPGRDDAGEVVGVPAVMALVARLIGDRQG